VTEKTASGIGFFSEWNESWKRDIPEGTRENPLGGVNKDENLSDIDKRCDNKKLNIDHESFKNHENNLKWEFELVSSCLNEVRRRKFFAINASMILFPGLIGALAAITSAKVGENNPGFYWLTVVLISMFIGTANMIAIKYIAAFKAQANLHLRQINCLRQAIDSIAYFRFEGKYPIHLNALMEGGVYYKVFGKHRKLPIGNEGLRNRFMGSFSESADKSLIGFLFFTSSILISAPYIYLMSTSLVNWEIFPEAHFFSKLFMVNATLLFLIFSVFIFIYIHRESFRALRTGDGAWDESQVKKDNPKVLFKYELFDFFPAMLILIPSVYWAFFSVNSNDSIYSSVLVILSVVSIFMFFMSVKKVFFDSLNRINKSMTSKSSWSR